VNKTRIRIRTQEFFNFYFKLIGIIFILLAILMVFLNWIAVPFLLIPGIIFATTHYWIEIDTEKGILHDYLWILGFRKGHKIDINEIDYLYLTKSKYAREYGFFPRAYEHGFHFNGYIKLKDEEKLMVGYSKSKKRMRRKLEQISKFLKLEIRDYSEK